MLEDRHRGAIGRTRACRLDAIGGIILRLLCRSLGDLHPLRADIDARVVHHREHRHQPAVLCAYQFADAVVIVAIAHHAGR